MNGLLGTRLKTERPGLDIGSVAALVVLSQVLAVDFSAFEGRRSSRICPGISI